MAHPKRKATRKAYAWNSLQEIPAPKHHVTAFERELKRLGMTEGTHIETLAKSEELRKWCQRFRHDRYIPEKLLAAFGMSNCWVTEARKNPKARVSFPDVKAYFDTQKAILEGTTA